MKTKIAALAMCALAAFALGPPAHAAGIWATGVAVGWTEEHYSGRIEVFTTRRTVTSSQIVMDRALQRCREAGRWNCVLIGAVRGRCFSIARGKWRDYEISGGSTELNLYGYGGGNTLNEADAAALHHCRSSGELTNCRVLHAQLRKCSR